MRLSFQQKQVFYYQIRQLVRSGIAFPAAVRTLAKEADGSVRTLLIRIEEQIAKGESVAGAFAAQYPAITRMERSVIEACERSGRVDQGCERLSAYFAAMAKARSMVIHKSLYPLFTLHFGIFMLGLPRLFVGAGTGDYLRHTFGVLALFYGVAAAVWLLFDNLARLSRSSIAADRFWRGLPVLGKIHAWFSLARFCATYEMQLSSGVNVMESLSSAGSVSQSAVINSAIQAALPEVRTGSQVGPLLGRSGAFPGEMMRTFRVGEETGKLDEELQVLTENFEAKALDRVAALSEWLPKLIYTFILVYLAYEIIDAYRNVLSGYGKMLDGY